MLDDNSDMTDETTMWEMDTLFLLRSSQDWQNISELNRPQIIGPDRASVTHTNNVLASFKARPDIEGIALRPDYEPLIDIRGTQARYVDPTATYSNFNTISDNGLTTAWCTMCSQEWYREVEMELLDTPQLRGSQVQAGYWATYSTNWGKA